MRHRKAGRKFGRNTSHRRAMLRNLAGNLVLHERIETTDSKAKELRRITERLLSQALRLKGELILDAATLSDSERKQVQSRQVHARRMVARFLPPRLAIQDAETGEPTNIDLVKKLFEEIAPRYLDRVLDEGQSGGGYTRIIKLGRRRGDNAPMSLIEFVGYESPLEREPAPSEAAAAPASDDTAEDDTEE